MLNKPMIVFRRKKTHRGFHYTKINFFIRYTIDKITVSKAISIRL